MGQILKENHMSMVKKNKKAILIAVAIIVVVAIIAFLINSLMYPVRGTYERSFAGTGSITVHFKGSKVEVTTTNDKKGSEVSLEGTWQLTGEESEYGNKIGIITLRGMGSEEFLVRDDGNIEYMDMVLLKK